MKRLLLAVGLLTISAGAYAEDLEYYYSPQVQVICFENEQYTNGAYPMQCHSAKDYNVQGLTANTWSEMPGEDS